MRLVRRLVLRSPEPVERGEAGSFNDGGSRCVSNERRGPPSLCELRRARIALRCVARWARLELATDGLEIRCSVLLSYHREHADRTQ